MRQVTHAGNNSPCSLLWWALSATRSTISCRQCYSPCMLWPKETPLSTRIHSGNPLVDGRAVPFISLLMMRFNIHLYRTNTSGLTHLKLQQLQISFLENPAMCLPRRFPVIWSSVLQIRRWCTTSATTDYACMEIAASSADDHVDLCITSATSDYTHMENAATPTGDHVDLCITSTTTDYTRMENAASSTGEHVGICITSTTTDYARMGIAASSTSDHVTICST